MLLKGLFKKFNIYSPWVSQNKSAYYFKITTGL